MPITISYDPVAAEAQMAANAGAINVGRQGFGEAMQLANYNAARQQQANAEDDRQQQLGLERQRQDLQRQVDQANEDFRYAALGQRGTAVQTAAAAHVAPAMMHEADRQQALQQLEQAHNSGIVDDVTYTRAQQNLLAGSREPMGTGASNLQQNRLDLSQQRFNFAQQVQGHLQQRRAMVDALNSARDNLNRIEKDPVRKYSPERATAIQALQKAQSDLATFDTTPMAPRSSTQGGGASSNTAPTGALKAAPRSAVRAALTQANGDIGSARAALTQQGLDPDNVVEDAAPAQ